MNNASLTKYHDYRQKQKINSEIAYLNNVLNKLENSQTVLCRQKRKSIIVGLIMGLITIIFLTTLIILNNSITLPLFACNITMGLICGLASKIIYYKETTKELRELIKNNNPTDIKEEIATLKEKTNTITPQTNFTKIKPCTNIAQEEKNKVYQLQKK